METNTPEHKKRPIWVWIITIVYSLSAVIGLIILYRVFFRIGFEHVFKYRNLSPLNIGLLLSLYSFNLAGAWLLFFLRREAFYFFAINIVTLLTLSLTNINFGLSCVPTGIVLVYIKALDKAGYLQGFRLSPLFKQLAVIILAWLKTTLLHFFNFLDKAGYLQGLRLLSLLKQFMLRILTWLKTAGGSLKTALLYFLNFRLRKLPQVVKKVAFYIGLVIVGLYLFSVINPYLNYEESLRYPDVMSNISKQIDRFNYEPNRDAATVLLDYQLLLEFSSLSNKDFLSSRGYYSLKAYFDLYHFYGNDKRCRWIKPLLKQILKQMKKKGLALMLDNYVGYYNEYEWVNLWRDIENTLLNNELTVVIDKVQGRPYLLAEMGHYLRRQGRNELALDYFNKAHQLLDKTDFSVEENSAAVELIIAGYISYHKNREAFALYQQKKEFVDSLRILGRFSEYRSFDYAFMVLEDDVAIKKLPEALSFLHSGFVWHKKEYLTYKQKKTLERLVHQYQKEYMSNLGDK